MPKKPMNWLKFKILFEKQPAYRWIFVAVTLAFSLMAWERILYADSAFTAFNILNLFPAVEHHRYTQWLILSPAYLGVTLGLPISSIVLILSISPVVLAWICTEFFRKNHSNSSSLQLLYFPAIFLVSGPDFQFLGTGEMISALIFAGMYALDSKSIRSTIWLALSYLAHPGILPALFFLLIVQKNHWKNYLFFTLIIVVKQAIIPPNPYEVSILQKLNFQDGWAFFQSWGFHYFVSSLFGGWATPYLILGLLILLFGDIKNYLLLGIGILISLFLAFIYREGESDMMMQKSFAPILPILWFLANRNSINWDRIQNNQLNIGSLLTSPFKLHHLKLGILLFCCFWGSYFVWQSFKFHHARLELLDNQLTQNSNPPKKAISSEYFHPDQFKINWAIPYESIIRSAYWCKKTTNLGAKTIKINTFCIVSDSNEAIKKPLGINQFLGAPFAYPIGVENLNPDYFSGLSKEPYQWISNSRNKHTN